RAEESILAVESTKSYKPIDGDAVYNRLVQGLLFGEDHEVVQSKRAATVATPGGTGALRVAADFIRKASPDATVWVSEPTWANHPAASGAAGLRVAPFPYFDAAANRLDFAAFFKSLESIGRGDVLLLRACCHNPTGADPSIDEWRAIGDAIEARGIVPLVDFAYQGFAEGLVEDARGLREIVRPGVEAFVASSF